MCGFHFWLNGLILEPTLTTVPVSQFSRSVSDPLQPHGLQHARLPCPSPTPGACSSSCPSSRWCHPTSSSSVVPFSSCLQSSPSSGSFPMSQLFASGGQSIGASASVFPMNIQDWFALGLTDWLDLLVVHGALKSLLQLPSSEASILWRSAFFMGQLSHPYMTTGKTIALTKWTFVGRVTSLLFNMLSRFVIGFLPRSKHLLISPSAVISEPKKIKCVTVSTVSPFICHEVMGLDAMIFIFWNVEFCQLFYSPLSLSSRGSFVSTPGGISYSPFCLFSTTRVPIYSF